MAYVLWHEEAGFCEGFLYLTQKRVREQAAIAFKKSWADLKSSGYSVRPVAIAPPLKNGWPMVGSQLDEWRNKEVMKALKSHTKKVCKNKETATAYLIDLGLLTKSGNLSTRYYP